MTTATEIVREYSQDDCGYCMTGDAASISPSICCSLRVMEFRNIIVEGRCDFERHTDCKYSRYSHSGITIRLNTSHLYSAT